MNGGGGVGGVGRVSGVKKIQLQRSTTGAEVKSLIQEYVLGCKIAKYAINGLYGPSALREGDETLDGGDPAARLVVKHDVGRVLLVFAGDLQRSTSLVDAHTADPDGPRHVADAKLHVALVGAAVVAGLEVVHDGGERREHAVAELVAAKLVEELDQVLLGVEEHRRPSRKRLALVLPCVVVRRVVWHRLVLDVVLPLPDQVLYVDAHLRVELVPEVAVGDVLQLDRLVRACLLL